EAIRERNAARPIQTDDGIDDGASRRSGSRRRTGARTLHDAAHVAIIEGDGADEELRIAVCLDAAIQPGIARRRLGRERQEPAVRRLKDTARPSPYKSNH